MKNANYTIFDEKDNRIGSVVATNKAQALEVASQKGMNAADATRVTSWQIKRSKISA